MEEVALRKLLHEVREGRLSIDEALRDLKAFPYEDIGFACIDHHRGLRKGLSEVIYGKGKRAEEIITIMEKMKAQGENILVTRVDSVKAEKISGERVPFGCESHHP